MKFVTKFNKVKEMPTCWAKYYKLVSLALNLIPSSQEQEMVKAEIDKVYKELQGGN